MTTASELADELQAYFDAPGLGFDKSVADAALLFFIRDHGLEIIETLRAAKPSLFVTEGDEEQSWDRMEEVADALTDYGAEPSGFGKVYRWAEMSPVWITVNTINDERVITEYATEESARQALTGEA